MTREEWEKKLGVEGYSGLYVQEDPAGLFYSDHTHALTSMHVILSGSMELIIGGVSHVLKEGDRFDVPANAVHSAKMGPDGCKYLIGEK